MQEAYLCIIYLISRVMSVVSSKALRFIQVFIFFNNVPIPCLPSVHPSMNKVHGPQSQTDRERAKYKFSSIEVTNYFQFVSKVLKK